MVLPTLGDVPWPTYVAMDDATSTTDVAGDEWEAARIARAKDVNTEDPESEEEEPAEEVVVMSMKQAVSQMRNILAFARRSGDVGMIDIATKLQGVVEDCAVRQAGAAKQMTIGDFLSESEAAINM